MNPNFEVDVARVEDVPEGTARKCEPAAAHEVETDPDTHDVDRCACGKPWERSESGFGRAPKAAVDAVAAAEGGAGRGHAARPVPDIEACDHESPRRRRGDDGGKQRDPRPLRQGIGLRPPRGSEVQVFTVEEVQQHTAPDDVWMTAHGKVYDVTDMVEHHPGGKRSILRHAGRECSVDFDFHSKAGQRLWAKYQIGVLDTAQRSCVIV